MPIWVARTPTRTPDRHGHTLARHGHARTVARARVRTSRARAAEAASTRQVVLGHQTVRQQNNTKGSRPWAARPRQTRAPMCFSRRGSAGRGRGASSGPPGACSARSSAPHALSSRFSDSSRFSEGRSRANFPPKKYSTTTKNTGSGKNIWTGNIYFLMACPL